MMNRLVNDILSVEVSTHGAELHSIRRADSVHEYLWQGDAQFWGRQAPVLFPIVGKVWENTAHIEGECYSLSQHGFARDREFVNILDEDAHQAYLLRADDSTLPLYPYKFALQIDYILKDNVLTVQWTVRNEDQREMAFQIGAHPAFRYADYHADDALHGYLSFNAASPLVSQKLEGGYHQEGVFEVPLPKDGLLPLTNSTFDCDTIIEATGRLRSITLHDKQRRPLVTVRHTMPITALWSPRQGASPFVCIEPWHGRCDDIGYQGNFAGKPYMEHASPGEVWQTAYEIVIG